MQDYIHSVPGRMRLKTMKIKKNPESADFLQRRLALINGVHGASINKITGSIVINYDHRKVNLTHILKHLEHAGVYRPEATISQEQYVSESMVKAGEWAGKFLLGATVERAIENAGISLISALI